MIVINGIAKPNLDTTTEQKMTIELIDPDTGVTMEVHGDKVSGLQYSVTESLETELTKLRNALDVAEVSLGTISKCKSVNALMEFMVIVANNALTTIKQAKG